jgi:hypothetical protein
MERFALDREVRYDVFDPDRVLVPVDAGRVSAGGLIRKRSLADVVRLQSASDTSAIVLRVRSSFLGDFEWTFDGSGRPSRHVCINPGDGNLLTILDLIAAAGDVSSAAPLVTVAAHRLHFLRWRAIQVLGGINAAAAAGLVQLARDDPHPSVRYAAEKSAAMMSNMKMEGEHVSRH